MTSDKLILVVGASRGIGEALVKKFAANAGNTVIALSRNLSRMEESFTGFDNVRSYAFDLNNDVHSQLDGILTEIGEIDYVINNAGYLVNKPFAELSHADIVQSYQVNVIGIMEAVQAFVLKMTSGHIVNISSMGGFQGSVKFPGLAAYSTSKAALCSFTELFSEEYKESSISMNCLCLGAVQTEMLSEAFPGYEAPLNPEEMADFIADFTMNGHRYMRGKILPVSLSTP